MAVSVSQTAFAANSDYTTTTTTFSAVSFGAAAADRLVFVQLASVDQTNSGQLVTSVTIGGISATKSAASEVLNSADQLVWFWAAVPTGTSGNIVVTNSTGGGTILNSTAISVYRVLGADHSAPVFGGAIGGPSGNPTLGNITILPNGAMLVASRQVASPAPTFSAWNRATNDGGTTFSDSGNTAALETGNYLVSGLLTDEQAFWSSGVDGFISAVSIQVPVVNLMDDTTADSLLIGRHRRNSRNVPII